MTAPRPSAEEPDVATHTLRRPRRSRSRFLAGPVPAVVSAVLLALLAFAPGGPLPVEMAFAAAPDGRLVVLWHDDAPATLEAPDVKASRRSDLDPRRSVVVARAGQAGAVASRLQRDPRVKAVVPDAVGATQDWPLDTAPNDTLWSSDQYDMRIIGMPSAWPVTLGSPTTVVAVLDTGYELTHPDLLGVPIVDPYNARTGSTNVADGYGHGTHVAGTIASATNNAEGVASVAPGVTIMPVKVLDADGYGYWSDFLEGVDWAVAHGAKVINMSLGSGLSSAQVAAFQPTFTAAWEAGVLVVAAAGNNSNSNLFYPASFASVISVSATNSSDTKANFSNYGPMIDLAAPGVGITSAYKGGTYKTMGGTSMATPHVAGLAALIRSIHPEFSLIEVETAMKATARDLGAAGRDDLFGYGRIVVPEALAWLPPETTPPVATLALPLNGATGVVETIQPAVAFDEAVVGADGTSITLTDRAGTVVPSTVEYDATRQRATIRPAARLASRTSYRVLVAGTIEDLAGNALVARTFSFTTGDTIKPTVISVYPARNATGIRRGVTARVVFSEPVRGVSGATVRLRNLRTGNRVTVTLRYDSATHSVTIDPVYRLSAWTWYRIKILSGIEDLAGRDLDRYWFSFRTRG